MAEQQRFDVGALTRRLDRTGLRGVWREAVAGELGDDLDLSWPGRHLVGILVVSGVAVGLAVLPLRAVDDGTVVPDLMFGTMAALLLGLAFWQSRASPRRRVRTIHRLRRFCRDNGFAFTAVPQRPRLPGVIFGYGSSRLTWGLCEIPGPGGFEVAHFRCETETGIAEVAVDHWVYLAFRLREPLPDSLLTTSKFPLSPPRHLLSGDLTRAWPRGEFRSENPADPRVAEVLSPALAAALTDARPRLHAEIVGDQLFVFTTGRLDLTSPRSWRRIARVRAALAPHLRS